MANGTLVAHITAPRVVATSERVEAEEDREVIRCHLFRVRGHFASCVDGGVSSSSGARSSSFCGGVDSHRLLFGPIFGVAWIMTGGVSGEEVRGVRERDRPQGAHSPDAPEQACCTDNPGGLDA